MGMIRRREVDIIAQKETKTFNLLLKNDNWTTKTNENSF